VSTKSRHFVFSAPSPRKWPGALHWIPRRCGSGLARSQHARLAGQGPVLLAEKLKLVPLDRQGKGFIQKVLMTIRKFVVQSRVMGQVKL